MDESTKKGTIIPTSSRGFPELPGTRDADVDYIRQCHVEFAQRSYPKVPLLVLDAAKTKVHKTYGDSIDKGWKDPVHIPMSIDANPSQWKLKKYGIEVTRDLMAYASIPIMEQLGIPLGSPTSLAGSLIEWDSRFYEVLSQHRPKESYWAQTNVPLFLVLTCQKYQAERRQ